MRTLREIAERYEIIIVDDGSPDRTGIIADKLARTLENVNVIHHEKNLGYGAALRSGFAASRFEIVAYSDGDNQFDIEDLKRMLPLLKEFDIVTGYRVNRAEGMTRQIESKIYNFLVSQVTGLRLYDTDCALKVFRREVVDSVHPRSSTSFACAEIMSHAQRQGFRIGQVAVKHYPRLHGRASGTKPIIILKTIVEMLRYSVRNHGYS